MFNGQVVYDWKKTNSELNMTLDKYFNSEEKVIKAHQNEVLLKSHTLQLIHNRNDE